MEVKKRSANFSMGELQLLQQLCIKYFSIIENKKSDAVSWQTKNAQWQKIATEFNAQGTTNRCKKVLKKKWENMKKNIKNKVAAHRNHSMGTGGGPPIPDLHLQPWEVEILDRIRLTAVGLSSNFDDDADEALQEVPAHFILNPLNIQSGMSNSNSEKSNFDNVFTKEISLLEDLTCSTSQDISTRDKIIEIETRADNVVSEHQPNETCQTLKTEKEKTTDWSTYNPTMLRTPVSRQLQIKETNSDVLRRYRKRPYTSTTTNKVWTELGEVKKKALQKKTEIMEADNELKRNLILESQLRQEEIKLKIELLKLEIAKKKAN